MTATHGQPQHMAALAKANRVRVAHAAVKRDLAAGTITIGQALEDSRAGTLTIATLLLAQRGWGASRMQKLLREFRISENKHVADLTHRQREAIVDRVENRPIHQTRQGARVVAVLLARGGGLTRTEIAAALVEDGLVVPDLEAALRELVASKAVVCRQTRGGYFLYDLGAA